ncbi:hypothetical protein DH2020_004149 [Rehmannia glutinosa]|uniref:Dof zinc finger protein n=1 Tax=Rehmannia glutinosa TaxID=99300 RepID=A0ABR0XNY5_REHGL
MDSLLKTSLSPLEEEPITSKRQQTPTAQAKPPPEAVSESGERRLSITGPPPQEPEQLSCPRCDSTNTKFCYYNNYNLSQPRHFCKACRRYWTRGGALRNVPVGGGTRKASSPNKRPRTAAATSSNVDNLVVSRGSDYDAAGRTQAADPNQDPGSGSANPNEAAVEKPGSVSCFWSSGQMGLGCGFFPFNGYGLGLGPGLDFEQAVLEWPILEQVSGGDGGAVVVSGESPGCDTWQIGGVGAEGGAVEGDYFTWPDLAISTPAEVLK